MGGVEAVIGAQQSEELEHIPQQPKLPISIKKKTNSSKTFNKDSIPDTGAQVCCTGPEEMQSMNIKPSSLNKSDLGLKHVAGKYMKVDGFIPLVIECRGQSHTFNVYCIPGVTKFFMSLTACKKFGLVHPDFPFHDVALSNIETEQNEVLPERPTQMPYPATEENILLLESWFLETFADSVFNITETPQPFMSGDPGTIHVKDDAEPYCANCPIPVPVHFKAEVERQLKRDVEDGILRKAPVNEATPWCMKMVVATKKDGSPRLTVDFQPLNKHCQREPHYIPRPLDVATSVPAMSYKSSFDAHNGYHQVRLDGKSVPYTTFITEYGRYQYLRVPQGFSGSGDIYCRRYDDIIADVPRKFKIVDDSLLYDPNLEDAFYHCFDYLILHARNGIRLNPKKFKFGRKELEFAGFSIGWNHFYPSDERLQSLKNFPMPDKPRLEDIRAWFGLVNQLAPFIGSSSHMSPFRELAETKNRKGVKQVYWDNQLKQIFERTRDEIHELACEGLSFYDTNLETTLITDYSKQGIGYVIMQKHCECENTGETTCCSDGWKLTICNSRFLKPEEKNYYPIEGEGLAVAWALQNARIYLAGCRNFTILVDHAPLVGIFNRKGLDEIENPRLRSYKERSLPFSFNMKYIKGISNHANTLSRYPVNQPEDDDDVSLGIEIAAVQLVTATINGVCLTMDEIKEAAAKDEQYQMLMNKVKNDSFAGTFATETPILKEFFNIRDKISIIGGLLMYNLDGRTPRTIIPRSLRSQVVENFHSANQGATAMLSRARQSVYWPNIDKHITNHVMQCSDCRENAPSQQDEPLVMTPCPEYPFQQVVSDLFEEQKSMYLVYADRLTGFVELAYFPSTPTSTTLINTMREYFHRWGAPEQIALDGASNLKSLEMRQCLKSWGVDHRLSSAYYPKSNGRAEAAVKSMKRLIRGNTGPRGHIDTDKIAMALLQHRNTPLRGMEEAPSELALGRQLRDTVPLPRKRYQINPKWAHHLRVRESEMSKQNKISKEKHDMHAKELEELGVGDNVFCQDTRTNKWTKSGMVVESCGNQQYKVKMDGSGRLSLRNRKHLREQHARIVVPLVHVAPKTDITNSSSNIGSTLPVVTTPTVSDSNYPSSDRQNLTHNDTSLSQGSTPQPIHDTNTRSARQRNAPQWYRDEDFPSHSRKDVRTAQDLPDTRSNDNTTRIQRTQRRAPNRYRDEDFPSTRQNLPADDVRSAIRGKRLRRTPDHYRDEDFPSTRKSLPADDVRSAIRGKRL